MDLGGLEENCHVYYVFMNYKNIKCNKKELLMVSID